MACRRVPVLLALLLLHGCRALPDGTEAVVAELARDIRDVEPTAAADRSPAAALVPASPASAPAVLPAAGAVPEGKAQKDEPLPRPKLLNPSLVIPPELPGSQAPPIAWPKTDAEKVRAVKTLYPPLPPLPVESPLEPGPKGQPLTLSDLQSLAAANHPSIRNAVAGIEAAKGTVKQAGAYPNPTIAWESDTIGTSGAVGSGTGGGGSGYQGGWVDQVIKGGNDLKLKTAAALMDLSNARLALKKARSDLATQVRSSYFAVLVARENIKASRALAKFTDEVYRVQVDLLRAGIAAPYEPMQLRPLALQARFNLYQAVNQYRASWRQLAANLGLPNMPPTELAGRIDLPVPVFEYGAVEDYVLNRHTDVLSGLNSIQKARYLLELARVAPFPDFDVRMIVQKDYTAPPFVIAWSGAVNFVLPVWDLNRGNIQQARGQLTQAFTAPQQTRLQLTGTLADAYSRYLTAKEQVQITMQQIQDQVRVYRGVYERYRRVFPAEVSFGDVVTAQQTLVTYVSTYITALGLQWTAVVDVASLLQTDDLFQTGRTEKVAAVPDLEDMLSWPWLRPGETPCTDHQAAAVGGGSASPVLPCGPEQTPPPAAGEAVRLGPVQSGAESAPVIQSTPAAPPEQAPPLPAALGAPR